MVYLLGVGLATAGSPLVAAEPTTNAQTRVPFGLLVSPLSGAIPLVPVTITIHYADEYADNETDALADRTPFSGGIALPLYGAAVVATPTPVALALVPHTLLVGCNLLATHWADREADAAVGKRTLAVR